MGILGALTIGSHASHQLMWPLKPYKSMHDQGPVSEQNWGAYQCRASARSEVARRQEGRGRQGVDPVLAPELVQQASVQAALEVADVQAVVGVGMHPEVLDLAQRDGLVLRGLLIWRLVVLQAYANTLAFTLLLSPGSPSLR